VVQQYVAMAYPRRHSIIDAAGVQMEGDYIAANMDGYNLDEGAL
jgi:hypothetical protein